MSNRYEDIGTMRDPLIASVTIFAVTLVSAAVLVTVLQSRAEAACISYGYPHTHWPTPFSGFYCSRMVNQSEVIVPLSQLQKAAK